MANRFEDNDFEQSIAIDNESLLSMRGARVSLETLLAVALAA